MSKGIHEYRHDPRNREILICVNGEHVLREEATVSVFDSGFVLGDGIWEGLRVHHGRIAFLDAHLDRLYEGAKALDLDIGLDRPGLTEALYRRPSLQCLRGAPTRRVCCSSDSRQTSLR